MKTKSLILSLAILVAFTFTSLTLAQTKPPDKSKTTSKTEKVIQNKTSQTKSLSHAATWNTKKNQNMKTAKKNDQKMAMTNDKKMENKTEMMKNKRKMNYKDKNHLKKKNIMDKNGKSNNQSNSHVK